MSEENTVLSFNDAISLLDNASESFKIEIWVPSKQKNITFKEIDAKQQKSLLSAAIDNSIYNGDFINAFYNILKENILEEDPSVVDNFDISDRSFIALSLRNQISNEISVSFSEELSEKFSLVDIISKFISYKSPEYQKLEVKGNDTTISVTVGLPTIKDEIIFEEEFKKFYKNVDEVKTTKDVKSLISEAFIGETSKYIKIVSVNDSEFSFNTLTSNQKLRVVEKLPSALIQKILETISNWKKDLDSYLTVKSGENSKVISVDSVLFLS